MFILAETLARLYHRMDMIEPVIKLKFASCVRKRRKY